MMEVLGHVLPHYNEISKPKKLNILNSFEEVEFVGGAEGYRPGTVLEHEGTKTLHLYIILKGYIHVYKRLSSLYEDDKLIKINDKLPLRNFIDPQQSNSKDIGVKVGSFGGQYILVGEESGMLKQDINYTLVAGDNLLVMRYSVRNALQAWPYETQRQLKQQSFEKYYWIY